MASIFQGFEYDIFISYRQKDNKHEGWVTKFVDNLKGELEATLKEDVSVYFDENPHDGLQDTHNVDKSLEGKLRCLIFIPILSQTYCDPNSYAWQYEFLAFSKLAKQDRYGRDIRLRSGNYASRILPIRIHDLEQSDIKLFEKETGSVLRAMDFVFKTATGVNRPLKPNEDHPRDNLNNIFYGDQVNRVANAIKEIISALGKEPDSKSSGKSKLQEEKVVKEEPVSSQISKGIFNIRSKKWMVVSFALLLCIATIFTIYLVINHSKQAQTSSKLDKSIAVLPFVNDSPDKENEYFCNGMMEEILNQLQKIKALRVKARTSVEKYRDTDKDVKEIGHELGVSLIMEGSVRKAGDDLRITAQLIDVNSGDHLWSESYDGKYSTAIFDFQSNIARKVATSLNVVISPKEAIRLDKKPTTEIVAYDLSVKGGEMALKFINTGDSTYARIALNLFNRALESDPNNLNAIGGIAHLYRFTQGSNYDSAKFYSEKLIKLDPENGEGWIGIGAILLDQNKVDSGLKYIQKAIDLSPENFNHNELMGEALTRYKNEVPKGLLYFQRSYDLGGNTVPYINEFISYAYFQAGYYDKALKYMKIALSLEPLCRFVEGYEYILLAAGKNNEAIHFLDSICSITPCENNCDILKYLLYTDLKEFEKAEKYYNIAVTTDSKAVEHYYIYLSWIYQETGRENIAEVLLKKSIKRDEELFKPSEDGWGKGTATLQLSAAYALLGDTKKALQYLSKLEKIGYLEWPCSIKTFPGFDNLRNDPEFKAILKRIEGQRAATREKVREMEQSGELHL